MENFLSGWDNESELEDFQELMDYQEYSGEPFILDWADVRDRIYVEAALYKEWSVKSPMFDYTVAQTKTNGCVSYGVSAGIEDTLDLAKQKGKWSELLRCCAPWLYGGYHNIIKGRPGAGGCSMSGMMRFIAQYGILPYDTQKKIYADGEVDWNWNPRSWQQVYEKFGSTAAKFKIKVAKLPRNFNDIVACLKAGYAVPYGTNKKLVLDKKTGFYYLSGSTMHCMCWSGYGGGDGRQQTADGSRGGFTYNKNSWCDGRGKQRLEDVKVQVHSNYFDSFVILDIERTRESKPNWGL
jgi:hypothetical protein